jgi:two-component system, NarL family, nitrate/nitrite response regulator NarL
MTSVLLADDHPFLRAGVEAVLRGSQYEIVATAATGEEALQLIRVHDPEICLLDVRMPGSGGIDVLEQLRAAKDSRLVVLLTAELSDDALVAGVRTGVNGIVLKDCAAEELVACLDTVLRGGRAIPPELLQRALELSVSRRPRSLDMLAPREKEIAKLVGRGMRNREIAESLGMSEGTIKVYLHAIYQKLGIDNRTELALLAHGRLSPGD